MRTIIITCGGGLGNRLMGLASAMVLAAKHGVVLKVYWPQGIPRDTGTSEGFYGDLAQLYHPSCPMISQLECNQALLQPHLHFSLEDQKLKPPVPAEDGVTYFYTHGAIRGAATREELRQALLSLKPTRLVRNHIATARILMDGYGYHGLLVRCHGHPKARRWNPAVKFKMFLSQQPASCYYLACDDKEAASQVMAAGHGMHRIITLPRVWRRNSADELATVAADIRMLTEGDQFYATPFCALTELVDIHRNSPATYPE